MASKLRLELPLVAAEAETGSAPTGATRTAGTSATTVSAATTFVEISEEFSTATSTAFAVGTDSSLTTTWLVSLDADSSGDVSVVRVTASTGTDIDSILSAAKAVSHIAGSKVPTHN